MTASSRAVERRQLARLWFGMLGGLVAWSAHLVLGYALITGACDERGQAVGAVAIGVAFLGLTIGLAAVATLAMLAAVRMWREGTGWRGFLGLFGVLLDGLAAATILLAGSQLLVLPPCL